MGTTSTEERRGLDPEHGGASTLPAFVEWLVAAALAVVGLSSVLGGTVLLAVVDRSAIERGVADGSIRSDFLSGPELVDVALSTTTWTGWGLLVVGAAMVLAGLVYLLVRRRARSNAEAGEPTSDFAANAILGALLSGALAFVPFAPVIGGGVAGYLERGESERVVGVGALSGLLSAGPVLVLVTFALAGLATGFSGVGEGTYAALTGAVILLSVAIGAVAGAGLGALGGYVGGRLAEDEF